MRDVMVKGCRYGALALVCVLLTTAAVTRAEAEAQEPTTAVALPEGRTPEAIRYDEPERYTRIQISAGHEALIRQHAEALRGEDVPATLKNIYTFIQTQVPDTGDRRWRVNPWNTDRLLKGFSHAQCAEHALLFANLARACGIPALYVKSFRHDWIRSFRRTGRTGSYAGHVFLEVFFDKRWQLLDAQSLRLWATYDPSNPELPGGLFAYEKGADHLAMVHSTRRDVFKAEAVQRFAHFDVTRLRVNTAKGVSLLGGKAEAARRVPTCYALTVGLEWRRLTALIPDLASFDRSVWAARRDVVRGKILIVTAVGGRVGLPPGEIEVWLPVTAETLREEATRGASAVRTRKLEDGTTVVLLSAPGAGALRSLLDRSQPLLTKLRHRR